MTDRVGAYAGPVYCRSHDDVMSGQTGVVVSTLTEWQERQVRYRRQDDDTARIAGILERHGVNPFREGAGFALVGLVTGRVKPAEQQYRRIHFLPSVAAMLRCEIATALEHYLLSSVCLARYGVFTTGPRCEVWEVKGRVVWLSRMISRWHHEICAPLGIDVLFRGVELPCDDGLTFHVHANVIYFPTRYLQSRKWGRFKKQTAAFFGAHWEDLGKLRDVREVVKYVMKGDDIARLADQDERLVVELYRQLKGLHLVQCLGGFRAWRRARKEAGEKVVAILEFDGRKTVIVKRAERRPREEAAEPAVDRLPVSNRVLSFGLPRAAFGPVKEPVALVSNFDPDGFWRDPVVMERARSGLKRWMARGNFPPRCWFPRGRSPFKVHTYTTTVGAGGACGRVEAALTGPDLAHEPRPPP